MHACHLAHTFHTPLTPLSLSSLFFFNDTATTEIYTLSLHDALPISPPARPRQHRGGDRAQPRRHQDSGLDRRSCADRKSTRLNSSHSSISYAVFCLKKKKKKKTKMQADKNSYGHNQDMYDRWVIHIL